MAVTVTRQHQTLNLLFTQTETTFIMPPDMQWHVLLLLLNQLPHAYRRRTPSWISNGFPLRLPTGPESLKRLRMRLTHAFERVLQKKKTHMDTFIKIYNLNLFISFLLLFFKEGNPSCLTASRLTHAAHRVERSFLIFQRHLTHFMHTDLVQKYTVDIL